MRHKPDGSLALTEDEERMGWTLDALLAREMRPYRHPVYGPVVSGNIVTEYVRGRPGIRVENCHNYDPHRHWKR